jgi:hypothetical protein
MRAEALPVVPPAPKIHAKDLPIWRHLLTAQRNSIGILPNYAFLSPVVLEVHAVPHQRSGSIRHMMATNALRSGMTLASGCTMQSSTQTPAHQS